MDEETQIIDTEEISYYCLMPNLADDELDLYEYRLYGHYRRVCGANNRRCAEKTRTTAECLGISVGMVSQARKRLEEKGYIRIHETKHPSFTRVSVSLRDVWPRNMLKYSTMSVHGVNGSVHGVNGSVHGVNASVHGVNAIRSNQCKEVTNSLRNNHHHQEGPTQNDDDDDDGQRAILKELVLDIAKDIPNWTGYQQFVDGLDQKRLSALLSWLWLWDLTQNPNQDVYALEYARIRYPGNPLDRVENIAGKIITQTRLGNQAPLHHDDADLMQRTLVEWAQPDGTEVEHAHEP